MALAALPETVRSGILISGDINNENTKQEYLKSILSLMTDEKKWQIESNKAIQFAQKFSWDKVAISWAKEFFKPVDKDITVSIVTPTIREGWWNLMANNIAVQNYKNLEWIIIDDYIVDRSDIAKKYADKYSLDIKYLRGNKKRKSGISHAYNVGCVEAKGELIISLQDFMLLPQNGVELLVREYKNHPNSLLAPVDMYFKPKEMTKDKEDAFNDEIEVFGELTRQNIRINNHGMRLSDNPADFELNIGAFSKKTFDELGGFYELFDDTLANFGNTEFAYRALKLGKQIIVYEHIVGVGIDLGVGTPEPNLPRYLFLVKAIENGDIGFKRDLAIDTLHLGWNVPKEVDPIKYAEKFADKIAQKLYDNCFGNLRTRS
jgi:glycosyltransferase involved in cell wall biosynthesis